MIRALQESLSMSTLVPAVLASVVATSCSSVGPTKSNSQAHPKAGVVSKPDKDLPEPSGSDSAGLFEDKLPLALRLLQVMARLETWRLALMDAPDETYSAIHHVFLRQSHGSAACEVTLLLEAWGQKTRKQLWYRHILEPCDSTANFLDSQLLHAIERVLDNRDQDTYLAQFFGLGPIHSVDLFQTTTPEAALEKEWEDTWAHERSIGVFTGDHADLAVIFNAYGTPLAPSIGTQEQPTWVFGLEGFANGLGVQHRVTRAGQGLAFQLETSDCGVPDEGMSQTTYGLLHANTSNEIPVVAHDLSHQSLPLNQPILTSNGALMRCE